jgi:hypothetical protein
VRRWLHDQLDELRTATEAVVVIFDHGALLEPADLDNHDAEIVGTWFELRRAYEQHARRRQEGGSPLVLIVQSDDLRSEHELPWDISRCAACLSVRIPVDPAYRQLVRDLPDALSDTAVAVLQKRPSDPANALLSAIWGVALPETPDNGRDVEVAARLRAEQSVPDALWALLRSRFQSPLARALAETPPRLGEVQDAWRDWVGRGRESEHAQTFEALGWRIAPLLYGGLIKPVPGDPRAVPEWARIGVRGASPEERVASLLAARPEPWPPENVSHWDTAAAWWGDVREAASRCAPTDADVISAAWAAWTELDDAFTVWLQRSYGELLTSEAALPQTVSKIAPFLARRLRQGARGRILLIVIDGMAFSQWATIRRAAAWKIKQSGACFAMLPTLTTISRQAIFTGALPAQFPETLDTTATEERAWRSFWTEQGLAPNAVRYAKVSGAMLSDIDSIFGGSSPTVLGVVVNAVDEMLHGSKTLGDQQMAAVLDVWLSHHFLDTLVERAVGNGYEVWITADHGNIEAIGRGGIQGDAVTETAGRRVRTHRQASVRDHARAEGLVWDPPGLPAGSIYPIFPHGRDGYFTGPPRLAHGGLSVDEVVVPFAQVTA